MLGWEVLVFRGADKKHENLVARWQTNMFGLVWLDQLVESSKAVSLGSSGYPSSYSAAAGVLLPIITKGLPEHIGAWTIGDDYVLPPGWSSEIDWNRQVLQTCNEEEPLFIDAWDQS